MTSSDVGPVVDAAPRRPVVLARGSLHPAMLFLRLLDGIRASLLPALIAVVSREIWIGGIAAVVFLASLLVAVVRFATFQYQLDEDELVTREGILNRQERRIPVNRIQDLSFEQSLLRRMLGIVVVSVETASGKGAEARLDSLSRSAAERMREALYRARGNVLQSRADQPAELVLWRAPASELFLLGVSTQKVGAILAAMLGVSELLRELRLVDQATGMLQGVMQMVTGMPVGLQVLLLVVGLVLLLLLGAMIATLGAFLLFHGFLLTLRDDVLVRRFGLITRHTHALPRRKIQRVLLEQSFLRLLLGRAVVKADSAGGGESEAEKQKSGTDVLAPLLPFADAERLVGWTLPGLQCSSLRWNQVSARAVVRMTLVGVLLAVVLGSVTAIRFGWIASASALLVPMAATAGYLIWRRAGWVLPTGHVALRSGMLGRTIALVPARKIQGVVLRAGPLDRLLGLARIVIYVAGGSPSTLAHLVRSDAEALLRGIAQQAARTRFVW